MKFVRSCLLYIALVSYASTGESAKTPACGEKCAKVLGLTNKVRVAQGLSKLCLNSKLMKTAEMHNNYQALTDTMTHMGPNGQTLGDRVLLNGYKFSKANENVAQGMTSAKTAMNGWLNSESHRENLLAKNVHMGVAYNAKARMWTQVFGTPMDEDKETCDVTTRYGKWGTTSSSNQNSVAPRSGCGRKCIAVLDLINKKRKSIGVHQLCPSPQLMAAAEELVLMKIGKKVEENPESVISDTGYSWKKYATLTFSLNSNRKGTIPNKEILNVIEKELKKENKRSISSEYSQIGFAGSNDGRFFKLIFASTWDIATDMCLDGSSPVDTGVDAKHGKTLDNESQDHSPNSQIAKAFGIKGRSPSNTTPKKSTTTSTTLAVAYGDLPFPTESRLNPKEETEITDKKPSPSAASSSSSSTRSELDKFLNQYRGFFPQFTSSSRPSSSRPSSSRPSSSQYNPWAAYNSRNSYMNQNRVSNPFGRQRQNFREGR